MDNELLSHSEATTTLLEQEHRLRNELEKIEKKRAKLDAQAVELLSQINAINLVLSKVLVVPVADHKPSVDAGKRQSLTSDVRAIVDNLEIAVFSSQEIAERLAEQSPGYSSENRDELSLRVRKTLARLARDGDTVEVASKGKGTKGTVYRLIIESPSATPGRSADRGRIENETGIIEPPEVPFQWRSAVEAT